MTNCSIIPPYLMDQLADSPDAAVAERARHTRALDARLREERQAARGGAGRRVRAQATGELNRTIYDAQSGTDLPGQPVRAEGEPATADASVTRAYDGLGATYALWQEVYGRNSLDNKGLPLLATVHYGQNYDNAFWNDTQMVFGDGDGTIFLDFTLSLDVIGHELAHGVTQYTSGLNYQDQPGALNEHISDVFGVLVKQRALAQSAEASDWLIGAELLAPGIKGVALRSMAAPGTAYDDPQLGKDPQPGHMRDYVATDADNGGVHINSGIPNKAFHDAAVALGGNAWERAGQIWYDTVVGDISADCDFVQFAALTEQAAVARYGADSAEHTAVVQAWQGVGVTEAATPEPAPADPPPEAASPATAGTTVTVRRSGGITGLVRERQVALNELPEPDAAQWQQLLGSPTLRQLSAHPNHPDAFSYDVVSDALSDNLTIPEQALPSDTRALFERTLESE